MFTTSMKKSMASKSKNDMDMMSNLPDPILQLILSGLPTTEEVVRTSILSTRWRYLWTLIPSLDIDCTRRLNTSTHFKPNVFKEFVSRVLVDQTLGLESVRLCCANHYDMSTVGRWIDAAVMRKVKSLDLVFRPSDEDEVIELPHSLVKCESLEVLRLSLYKRPISLPTLTGFPALRVLELNNVELLDDDLVQMFFKSCPLLEDLSLIGCVLHELHGLCISSPNLKTLRIDNRKMDCSESSDDDDEICTDVLYDDLYICCPKLVFLEYAGHMAYDFTFENLDSLKKAVIYPVYVARKQISVDLFGKSVCEFLAEVSPVESLSINFSFIEAIRVASDPHGVFPDSLLNLKTLEISTTINNFSIRKVIRMLICSPNLESFHLIIEGEAFGLDSWELDELVAHHLKRVKFLDFNGQKRNLDMARFLLRNGDELEEMVFSWRERDKINSDDTMKKVQKFKKASSIVKLITLFKD